MQPPNIYSRRSFLDHSFKVGLGVALSTLVDIPLVMKRALAEGTIGVPGPDHKVKKVLFIFLRGANDALNSVIPIVDSAYQTSRPGISIAKDPTPGYDYTTAGNCFDPTQYADVGGTSRGANDATFSYDKAIKLGNGFAALHPSLKFLAPIYNAGDLALVHRVGYPKQSRSHFDSQNYWENGSPNDNLTKDGIFYRAMIESGLANTSPLTGVSIQSTLPLLLRGSAAAMTNLSDPTRYNLFGIPNSTAGNSKADTYFATGNSFPYADKRSRELLDLQYQNLADTLKIFEQIKFDDANNTFQDDISTDSDARYYLFPTKNEKNGGANLNGRSGDTSKYVVDTGAYSLFTNLKAAALVLNKTDAIVAGTEYSGFDTHNTQGGATGTHSNLMRRLGWALYALRKYFKIYGDRCTWDNLIVVTLSEFGRTTVQNGSSGTDHAEGGVMFVAGGAVQGYGKGGRTTGVHGCSPDEFSGGNADLNWNPGPRDTNPSLCGTMWAASPTVLAGYLKRQTDYRSVLGEVLRKHLGAAFDPAQPTNPSQLSRIIPGYESAAESLFAAGNQTRDNTKVRGEVGILT